MLGESHELIEEFPEYKERILELKDQDDRFAKLFDDYHRINNEVIRIEQGLETPSDYYTEELKKKRLLRKDQLYRILTS
jgi:uncharacterized protein YdcH (DUF465 family)